MVKYAFGTWHNALVAAGLSQPIERPNVAKRNREKVIAALQARQQQGLGLRRLSKDSAALDSAARRYFGTLQAAALAAGIEE